jgi:hypothetical protein
MVNRDGESVAIDLMSLAYPAVKFNVDIDRFVSEDNQTKAEITTEYALNYLPGLIGLISPGNKGGTLSSEKVEMATVHRGINESSPAFSNALKGIVEPKGGNATVAEHNAEY